MLHFIFSKTHEAQFFYKALNWKLLTCTREFNLKTGGFWFVSQSKSPKSAIIIDISRHSNSIFSATIGLYLTVRGSIGNFTLVEDDLIQNSFVLTIVWCFWSSEIFEKKFGLRSTSVIIHLRYKRLKVFQPSLNWIPYTRTGKFDPETVIIPCIRIPMIWKFQKVLRILIHLLIQTGIPP